jgi:hypothetical protein
MDIPGYWMNETSGALEPVVNDYLNGRPLTDRQVATMRAYLRQWISYEGWDGVELLRVEVDDLLSSKDIQRWLDDALLLGLDPL